MTEVAPAPTAPGQRDVRWLAAPLVAFALFSLSAGLLARHRPRSKGYFRLFFSDPVHLKAGFATAAVALACFQLFSAAWIFRKLPWPRPRWIGRAHRWSGRLALLFTLPVAYHCIFKLGFQTPDGRVLAHSLFGCAVYGAFAAKVTIVRLHRFPTSVLPLAGGLLFAVLIGVWYTSSVWLYEHTTNAAPPSSGAPGAGHVTRSRRRAPAVRSGRTSTRSNRPLRRPRRRSSRAAARCRPSARRSRRRRSAMWPLSWPRAPARRIGAAPGDAT